MKKIASIFILYVLFYLNCFASKQNIDLENMFSNRNKGEIVYYDGSKLESDDYLNSIKIKEMLESEGNDVYSITIADVFGNGSNQYIAVFENNKSREKRVVVFSSDSILFEYKILNANNKDVKIAIDLESFKNKNKNVGVIKLYVMNEYENKKTVDLHLFISYNNRVSLLSNIIFYNEVRSINPFVSKVDIVFVDVDNDGSLEMLVLSSQKIAGREEKIEYLTYKFDYKLNNYVCIGSWHDDTQDYAVYFN